MRCFWQNYYCLCILVALLNLPVHAAELTLAWTPSPDLAVAGYNLYFGGASGHYTNRISAGNATQVTVSGLVPGTIYYFAATAFNASGLESSFSSELSYQIPPMVPSTNQPPTLNAINDLAFGLNAGLQTVNLSGISSGAASENQTLTIRVFSSNPGLIPNPTVSYNSPSTTGRLTFRPAHNVTGTSMITVIVSDNGAGNNSVTRTFNVTVTNLTTTPGGGPTPPGGGHTAPGGGHTPPGSRRPVLSCQLTNQTALTGQTRTFAITASGSGALKYQWKFNGTVLSTTASTLTLNNVTTNQSGIYSVTVTDRNVSTNSAASLTVYATAAGSLAPASDASGQYALNVGGVPGCRYIVQASTDFVNWVPVQTNTAPFTYVDAQAGQFSQRFYRSVYTP